MPGCDTRKTLKPQILLPMLQGLKSMSQEQQQPHQIIPEENILEVLHKT